MYISDHHDLHTQFVQVCSFIISLKFTKSECEIPHREIQAIPHSRGEKALELSFPTKELLPVRNYLLPPCMCPPGFWRFQMFQGLVFGFHVMIHAMASVGRGRDVLCI